MKWPIISPAFQTPVHTPHQHVTQPHFFNPMFFSYKWKHEFPEGTQKGIMNQREITEDQLKKKPHYVEPYNECVKARRQSNKIDCLYGLVIYYGLMEFFARSPTAKIPIPVRFGVPGLFVAYCLFSKNLDVERDCQQKMVWNKL